MAFFLSFLLPGAGLAYLGKWRYGAMNLAAALALGIILGLLLSDELFDRCIRYVAIGISCGSGGLARMIAEQMNSQTAPRSEIPEVPGKPGAS